MEAFWGKENEGTEQVEEQSKLEKFGRQGKIQIWRKPVHAMLLLTAIDLA